MKVLVTFAVEAEFAPWRTIRTFNRVRVNANHYSGGVEVYEAKIGSCVVWVFLTGIGIKCFNLDAASCFKDAGVTLVLSSGLAGSLKPEIKPEDVVAPRKVGNLRDASGLAIAPEIAEFVKSRGATSIPMLLTSDHIIEMHEEKNRLAGFGEAVDMESFHVVKGFIDQHVPVGVVRGISDGSGTDLPVDFEKCLTPQGQVKAAPLFRELMARPKQIPELIRFGLQSRKASRKLASFLDGLIEALSPDILSRRATEVAAS